MSTVVHFEYKRLEKYIQWDSHQNVDEEMFVKTIGCGTHSPDRKAIVLDRVTCGRCKRSRSYKAYRAFVLGLIDKKMLREIGLGLSGKLA